MSDVFKKTLKDKVSMFIISMFVILIIVCGGVSLYIYQGTTQTNKFFIGDVYSATYYEVNNQYLINSKLNKIMNDRKYSLGDAYVELNPYKVSPLSGIIIFQTLYEEKIRVYINGEFVTTTEASRKHAIPIYGLLEDYENIVKVESEKDSQEYIIKTDKSNIDNKLLITNKTKMHDNLYFVSSVDKKQLTGWDTQGRLRFYLNDDNAMDIEWLPNNHFLIGTTQGSVDNEYMAFVEMDYLGKIYNYYTTKHGLTREMQVLTNGNIMVQGGNTPVNYEQQIIYTIDPRNGKIVSSINIYDVIKNIDNSFDDKFLGSNTYSSGFYYDEKNNDLVVSNRDNNIIYCFDYTNSKLKWILTNPSNPVITDNLKTYLINMMDGNYPVQPNGVEIKDGKLFYLDGGIDRYAIDYLKASTYTNSYKNNNASGKLITIMGDAKTGYLTASYKSNVPSLSDGYTRTFDDGTKLVSYSSLINKESLKSSNSLFNAKTSSRVVEYNTNDEIIFDGTIEGNYYRIFKHELYADETNNIKFTQLKQYNTIPSDEITESSYRKINLDESIKWEHTFEFTANTLKTDYEFTNTDKVDILLVNRSGKIFILNYLDNSKYKSRIFNISLPVGEYTIFIKVNSTLYRTNKVYQF